MRKVRQLVCFLPGGDIADEQRLRPMLCCEINRTCRDRGSEYRTHISTRLVARQPLVHLTHPPMTPGTCRRELCEMLHLNRKAEIQIVLSSRSGLSGGQPPTSIYEPEETLGDEDGKNGENANGTNGKGGEGRENPLVAYLAERMGRPALPECQ